MPGLGKGLSSLIPNNLIKKVDEAVAAKSSSVPAQVKAAILDLPGERVLQIPTEKINANPYQPRQNFSHGEMEELVESIKSHGILQPLIVSAAQNNQYDLIAGERRLRAAKILEMKTVPAILRQARDQQRLELALIENIQRQDLNPIEEAQGYEKLLNEFNLNQEDVAKRVGKSRATVNNTLRLLKLPNEVKTAVLAGKISASHARSIAALDDLQDQLDLFNKIVNEKLSVREVEQEAKKVVVAKHLRRVNFDPILDDMTDTLRTVLGTKVSIKKHGDQGNIVINFYSEEELNNLVKKISGV